MTNDLNEKLKIVAERNYSNEIWMPIKGYEEKYMVSSFGRVKSMPNSSRKNEKILRLHCNKRKGSHYFGIKLCLNGKVNFFRVCRLVAIAFIAPIKGHNIVNHIDSDSLNDHFSNLEWSTSKLNNEHTFKFGNGMLGEKHNLSKFKNKDVIEIRANWEKLTVKEKKEIAKKHNITYCNLWAMAKRKTYKSIL